MSRPDLGSPPAGSHAIASMEKFHEAVVAEVRDAVANHDVVVVGMAWNPHVKRVRKALDDAGVVYHYLGYGNYLGPWRERLAIKLWSGWPTFPQVFVRGELLGGANQCEKALEDGSLQARLAA